MTDPEFEMPEFSYSRRRRQPAFDPLMQRIALGAGGVAFLVIVVALAWSGLRPGAGFGPPPVISAPPGPLRVAPANPGGITLPGADQQIMSGQSSAAPQALAPDGAAPDIAALQPPPPPAPPPPAPGLSPGLSPGPARASATPSTNPPAKPASQPPSALAPVALPPPVPAAGDDRIQVQLAAAIDPAGAHTAWARLRDRMPGLLAGRAPLYTHARIAGVEFWRLRVGGFADPAAARQFCAAVKAHGSACAVAAF